MAGYDTGVEGYLLKPVAGDRFERFFARHLLPLLLDYQTLDIYSNRLLYRLPVKRILYIESIGRKCLIHTAVRTYTTNLALSSIEAHLGRHHFLRCHRSYLVNLSYVLDVLDTTLLLNSGEQVPLTLRKRSQIIQSWHRYLSSTPSQAPPGRPGRR